MQLWELAPESSMKQIGLMCICDELVLDALHEQSKAGDSAFCD